MSKKVRRLTRRKAQHPCQQWCGQTLLGIVERLKLTGEIPQEFELDIVPLIGLMRVPADTYTLTCQHKRQYAVLPRMSPEGNGSGS